jgi:hypothetical protein
MGRHWDRIALAACVTLATVACIDGRTRPMTGVEDARDPRQGPLAVITHPVQGQRFFPEHWVSGSGVQVTYAGIFRNGDEIRLLAYLDYENLAVTQPFHVWEYTVQGEPDKARFVKGTPELFREAVGVTLLLEMYDPQGYLISVDSVNTEIQ